MFACLHSDECSPHSVLPPRLSIQLPPPWQLRRGSLLRFRLCRPPPNIFVIPVACLRSRNNASDEHTPARRRTTNSAITNLSIGSSSSSMAAAAAAWGQQRQQHHTTHSSNCYIATDRALKNMFSLFGNFASRRTSTFPWHGHLVKIYSAVDLHRHRSEKYMRSMASLKSQTMLQSDSAFLTSGKLDYGAVE